MKRAPLLFLLAVPLALLLAFAGRDAFLARMGLICDLIAEEPAARLPGSRRYALREGAASDGVDVSVDMLALIDRLGGRAG